MVRRGYRRHNRVLIGGSSRNLGNHNLLVTRGKSVSDEPRVVNGIGEIQANGTFNVRATWLVPSDPDIIITGYEIEHEQVEAPTVAWTGTQVVTGLTNTFINLPEGVYRVRVRTLHGSGPSEWVESSTINAFINISFNWNGQPSFHTVAA